MNFITIHTSCHQSSYIVNSWVCFIKKNALLMYDSRFITLNDELRSKTTNNVRQPCFALFVSLSITFSSFTHVIWAQMLICVKTVQSLTTVALQCGFYLKWKLQQLLTECVPELSFFIYYTLSIFSNLLWNFLSSLVLCSWRDLIVTMSKSNKEI